LDVRVRGNDWKWVLELQIVASVHSRFEKVVGTVDSYSVEVQLVRLSQERSEIADALALSAGATNWYCELEQMVNGAQTVSSVVASGFVAYALDAQIVFVVQVLSECVPAAVLSY
jgi:hypothetical protein